ncbi:MAG: di-heme oxidoredictase family protein [Polyangiales bacterium]
MPHDLRIDAGFGRNRRRDAAPMPPPNPDRHAGTPTPPPGALGGPLPTLTAEERARFDEGRRLFTTEFREDFGLGPYYEERSCASCHFHPVVGGTALSRLLWISPGPPPDFEANHHPAHALPGWPARTPPPGSSYSRPRPLFGLGLLESVPDETVIAGCDPDDRDHDGVRGRPSRYNRELLRFGAKAHQRTVRDFSQNALFDDINITSGTDPFFGQDRDNVPDPEVSERFVDLVAAFVRGLAPPPRNGAHPAGEAVFQRVGCATCHRPDTGPQAPGAYTDLCLHDMGPELANYILDKAARGADFRTPPLWGLRHQRLLLHNGAAHTPHEAIALHGGEGARSRDRYLALSDADRAALLAFLETL